MIRVSELLRTRLRPAVNGNRAFAFRGNRSQQKRRKESPESDPAVGETATQRVQFSTALLCDLARYESGGVYRVVSGKGMVRIAALGVTFLIEFGRNAPFPLGNLSTRFQKNNIDLFICCEL